MAANGTTLRFAVPPSLGAQKVTERAKQLEAALSAALGKPVTVVVAQSYETLARELLSGKTDAAWAPPFVCARIEAMGVRVLVRGVRHGASTYRAALLAKRGAGLALESLAGRRAAWADRDSVGGYLLPMALLRAKGLEPAKVFAEQNFVGSYRACLDAVLSGEADVTSIFAPKSGGTGLPELLPEKQGELEVVAFTDESPNDGVAVAVGLGTSTVALLEKVFTSFQESESGRALLKDTFAAERFETAPRMGYRALYRVALASL